MIEIPHFVRNDAVPPIAPHFEFYRIVAQRPPNVNFSAEKSRNFEEISCFLENLH